METVEAEAKLNNISHRPDVYYVEEISAKSNRFYLIVKRAFDFIFSLLSLIVLYIPMTIIAICIRLESPGPAIFKQERVGKNGKIFIMYKFRSMRIDAEEDGPRWAEEHDERCTWLGAKLRKCRLDELPQLWNIIKGDMSIVGPRPERPCFYEEFETYIHGFSQRLLVTPGLTGHAQVNGGYSLLPEEKILYDVEYIKNQSFKFDLQCVMKTISVILTHNGAR